MDCEIKYDFQRICRICLIESNSMIDLFQPGIGDNVSQVISLCSGHKISADDGLPKQICNECINLANTAYLFRQRCENADIKLKEYLLRESASFKKQLGIMELNDIGDYFQYDTMATGPLFPSPRHALMECDDRPVLTVTYECHLCRSVHKSCRDLVDHVISTHSTPLVQHSNHRTTCEVCEEKFSNEFDCNKHKSTHAELFTVNDTISCPFCVELFTKHKSQQKHVDTHVASSYNKCEKCQCYFTINSQLKKHIKIFHVDSKHDKDLTMDSDILKTNLCLMDDSYSFLNNELDLSVADLIPNIDDSNLNSAFINQEVDSAQCITEDDANKVLSEVLECVGPIETYLKENKREECQVNEDNIQYDELEITTKTGNTRIRTYGESTPIRCSPSRSTKTRRSRSYKRIFNCSQCPESFVRLFALEKHEARHRGEKNILCAECGKGFYKKSLLEKHIRKNHKTDDPKKTFSCPVCCKEFTQSNYLKCHMKTHKDKTTSNTQEANAYICTICGKALSSNSNLHVHMRRHTGNMTCVCKICGKGYPRKTELKLHMRRHTGEKPFKCDICPMAFPRADALKVHIRSHTDERPYTCTKCNRGFKQCGDLNVHIKKKSCRIKNNLAANNTTATRSNKKNHKIDNKTKKSTSKNTTEDVLRILKNSKELKVTLQKQSNIDDLVKSMETDNHIPHTVSTEDDSVINGEYYNVLIFSSDDCIAPLTDNIMSIDNSNELSDLNFVNSTLMPLLEVSSLD